MDLKRIFTVSVLICALGIISWNSVFAQIDGVQIDYSVTPPVRSNSAVLELNSTQQGFLAPRVVDRASIASPATGLLVYQTGGVAGFYYWTGTAWTLIGNTSGNLATLSNGTGIGTFTYNGSAASTVGFDYSTSLSSTLASNQTVFGTTGIIFEGSTSNAFQGLLTPIDPSADRTWTLPDASGTIALSSQVVPTTRTITMAGTTNQLSVSPTGAQDLSVNRTWTYSISDNAVLPGTGAITIPIGTTVQQPGTPTNGMFRYNSTTNKFEFRENGSWVNFSNNAGTVTSVGLSLPSIFSVSGTPVTSSGTLTGTFVNQTANTIFAGPASGAAAAPTFRSLVAADIPTGSTGYIQNQNAIDQLASFRISGNGIFNGGNVGIGATAPSRSLDVAGDARVTGVFQEVQTAGSGMKAFRNLAAFSVASANQTGAFVIETNVPMASNTMTKTKIDGYFYDATGPFSLEVGGYFTSGGGFANRGYINVGSKSVLVRFGRNASTGNVVIILGDVGDVFQHPRLHVTYFMGTHSTLLDSYGDNWSIIQTTDLSAYNTLTVVPDVTNGNNYIQNQNTAAQSGSNFWISGSGTFGNGTAALPTINFNSSPTTGLFRATTDAIGFTTAASESMRLGNTGNLGIGTVVPSSTGALTTRTTATSNATRYGIDNQITISDVTLTAARSNFGINNILVNQNEGIPFALTQYAIFNRSHQNTAAGNITSAFGAYNNIYNQAGSVTNGYGAYNYADNRDVMTTSYGAFNYALNTSTGTQSSSFGAYNYSQNTGNTTTARAAYNRARADGASVVTNMYATQNLLEQATSATVGTAYGTYTSFTGTFGTKWGSYITGEDKNYFSNNVGISTTTPVQALHVKGAIEIEQTSGATDGFIEYKNQYQTNADWQLVYRFDFESGNDGFVCNTLTTNTTNAVLSATTGRQAVSAGMGAGNYILTNCCLSSYSRNPVFKKLVTLTNIPHTEVMIKLTYYYIDSWDGGNERGWMGISPSQTGVPTLIWSKLHDQGWTFDSHWHGSSSWGDISYTGEGVIRNSSNTFWIHIGSNLNDNPADESFGIDNVEVWVR